jgi:hypothetical protein
MSTPPAYRPHTARNCAVVTIHGKNHYLAPYGSAASHEKYARLIQRKEPVANKSTGNQTTSRRTPSARPAVASLRKMRAKLQCSRCRTICETCCEGGRSVHGWRQGKNLPAADR